MTVISFIITIIGCLNWLCIGFFQFDFIAGLFGTQSSIFSRLIYILFGASSVFLTYAVIRFKGRLTLKSKKQDKILMGQMPQNNQNTEQNMQNNAQNTQNSAENQQNSAQNNQFDGQNVQVNSSSQLKS